LIVAGALAMIAHLLHITAVAMAPAPPPPPANMSPAELRGYETGAAVGKLGAGCCLMFVGLPIDILIIVGGVKLMNCTSRRMANTGSVLAMLPCSLAWPITLGLGIWALVVSYKNDSAFD
jgi:hypothetical protein